MMNNNITFTVKYLSTERVGTFTLSEDSTIDQLKKRLLRKLNLLASNAEHIKVSLSVMMGRPTNLISCMVPLFNDYDMLVLLKR